MQVGNLTIADLKANARAAQARVEAALAEYEAAKAELAWWLKGLQLADPDSAEQVAQTQDPAAVAVELLPASSVFQPGFRPTLRQAIVRLMREHPEKPAWTIRDLAEGLQEKQWLPAQESASKRIGDMAALMYNAGQLSRLDRGVYKLSPPVEAALDRVQRGTDYVQAAMHGFPVPDRLPDEE